MVSVFYVFMYIYIYIAIGVFLSDILGSAQVIPDVLKLIFPGQEEYDNYSLSHALYANILVQVNSLCTKMMVTLPSIKLTLPSIQLNYSPWNSLISK